MVGFGQSQFNSHKTKKNNKDKYHLTDDYKLLSLHAIGDGSVKTQNLKSIITKMEKDGFDFRKPDGKIFFSNHGFNPFLAFSKSVGTGVHLICQRKLNSYYAHNNYLKL